MTRSQLPRGYVRFYENGKAGQTKSKLLRLPQEIARLVDVDQIFKFDLDEAGIHLIPTNVEAIEQTVPTWARVESESEPTPEPEPTD